MERGGPLGGGGEGRYAVGYVSGELVPLVAGAMRAAVRGGEVVRRLQRGALTVERKADDTPVTEADTRPQTVIKPVSRASA